MTRLWWSLVRFVADAVERFTDILIARSNRRAQ